MRAHLSFYARDLRRRVDGARRRKYTWKYGERSPLQSATLGRFRAVLVGAVHPRDVRAAPAATRHRLACRGATFATRRGWCEPALCARAPRPPGLGPVRTAPSRSPRHRPVDRRASPPSPWPPCAGHGRGRGRRTDGADRTGRVDDGSTAYTDLLWRRAPGELRELRACESRLAREAGDLRFVFDERAPDVLDTLMRWHSARCRTVSRPDPLARPAVRALVSDLHDTRAGGCSGLVSALYANGRLIACTFGLRSRRVLVNRFPAYDTAFARYSLGLLMYLMPAEGAAGRGIDRIELGRGCGEGHEEQVKSADVLLGRAGGNAARGSPGCARSTPTRSAPCGPGWEGGDRDRAGRPHALKGRAGRAAAACRCRRSREGRRPWRRGSAAGPR
ncbi:GNAT family N-acetyltransferase [Streptomyces sp. RKND-216]|nr:GNAT family N-acetyltransferase [Streptomyces sp. RKND-216]